MPLGYPTESGYYWARFYEWNRNTLKYDIMGYEWIPVRVNSSIPKEYHVSSIDSYGSDDVRRIWECEVCKSPST